MSIFRNYIKRLTRGTTHNERPGFRSCSIALRNHSQPELTFPLPKVKHANTYVDMISFSDFSLTNDFP